jgi:hypothetical protein
MDIGMALWMLGEQLYGHPGATVQLSSQPKVIFRYPPMLARRAAKPYRRMLRRRLLAASTMFRSAA